MVFQMSSAGVYPWDENTISSTGYTSDTFHQKYKGIIFRYIPS